MTIVDSRAEPILATDAVRLRTRSFVDSRYIRQAKRAENPGRNFRPFKFNDLP